MSKITAVLGILVLATVSMGIASPASATTSNRQIDCATDDQRTLTFFSAPNDSIDFLATSCNRVRQYDVDDNRLSSAGMLTAGSHKVILAQPRATAGYFQFENTVDSTMVTVEVIEYDPAYAITGSLLATHDATITANPSAFTVTDSGNGGHDLAGNASCTLQANPSGGSHVYGTIDIHITTAGTYTFRSLGSNPPGDLVDPQNAFHPLGDSMLAVYSAFDPAHPDQGVVGCNDDSIDQGAHSWATMTSSGTLIEGSQPWFQAHLQPGNYTLVVTTWEELTPTQWQSGTSVIGGSFAAGAASNRFELWGPQGGLTIGHVASSTAGLANTGINSFGVVAVSLGVISLGLIALVLRRRRAPQSPNQNV
jgi:hypothetical protein